MTQWSGLGWERECMMQRRLLNLCQHAATRPTHHPCPPLLPHHRKAAELSKVRGKLSCLVINDLDAGIGRFGNTQVGWWWFGVCGGCFGGGDMGGALCSRAAAAEGSGEEGHHSLFACAACLTPAHPPPSSCALPPLCLLSCPLPLLYPPPICWPQVTVNNQIVIGTLMNICDDPNRVSVGAGWRENDTIRRVPIIVTGGGVVGCGCAVDTGGSAKHAFRNAGRGGQRYLVRAHMQCVLTAETKWLLVCVGGGEGVRQLAPTQEALTACATAQT